mmetsp:Transcript_108754/g.272553  ORF Transcript_108754/g.272553 Transcript_108754/m.272553 type:complete len:204 (+) Transcript_108754:444-1055(+)
MACNPPAPSDMKMPILRRHSLWQWQHGGKMCQSSSNEDWTTRMGHVKVYIERKIMRRKAIQNTSPGCDKAVNAQCACAGKGLATPGIHVDTDGWSIAEAFLVVGPDLAVVCGCNGVSFRDRSTDNLSKSHPMVRRIHAGDDLALQIRTSTPQDCCSVLTLDRLHSFQAVGTRSKTLQEMLHEVARGWVALLQDVDSELIPDAE